MIEGMPQKISENEAYIINTLRDLKPYEQIVITADAMGKPDYYLLVRSSKVFLKETGAIHVK